MSRMWLLRRLKIAKLDSWVLMDYYKKEIRPLTEHGVAIWNSGLTKAQIDELEKVQKVALKIILDENYISYEVACTLMNIIPLEYRRLDLATNFAIRLYKSQSCKEYFEPVKKSITTRNNNKYLVKENKSNTRRCYNAPHNYLARLINKNKSKIENWK